jgi:hypothetical protein
VKTSQVATPAEAIEAGLDQYADIRDINMRCPVLAIFAIRTINTSESGAASKRVLYLSHADHYVFLSNESDVLKEMNAFLDKLP